MQSSQPLPPPTYNDALDTLARLYVGYADPALDEQQVRVAIKRMTATEDIEATLLDIGKGLQMAERGMNFTIAAASQKALLATAGESVLEKFYFHARNVDKVIDHQHTAMNFASDNLNKTLIEQARLNADIAAYRRVCRIHPFKDISGPVLDGLFGETGMEVPYVDPASIPADNNPTPGGMA